MASEATSKMNHTRSILRSPGSKRVRMENFDDSCAEDITTTLNFTPKTASSIAFKTVASKNLSTHLPQLHDYLKDKVESFGSIYANVFVKNRKSNDIMAVDNYVPASVKFKFKPMLLDSIVETKECTALLSEVAEYVENCHQELGKYALQAFETNRREMVARLDKK